MKLARYQGKGVIEVVEEMMPLCPPGGVLIKTIASGLCSGELMEWYMDRKIPHVLGHEVSGSVIESQTPDIPVGSLVAPHHHVPCLYCLRCKAKQYVHCHQWRTTKFDPGGMAEYFAISAEMVTECHIINDLDPKDACLMEPLACVAKSIKMCRIDPRSPAVIGLGAMGLLHALALGDRATGYEINPKRRNYAESLGIRTGNPSSIEEADVVFVCPGTKSALEFALKIVAPQGVIVLFAPFAPSGSPQLDLNELYFKDITIATSYSAGPDDCEIALTWLRQKKVTASQVFSDFIDLDQLPDSYNQMKEGKILKPMVIFS